MPAFTTRLSLYKPGGGSSGLILPDEVADIDKINGDWDIIDAAIGFYVCTSATRPATPYPGQPIFETDTGNLLYWNSGGARWDLGNARGTLANAAAVAAKTTGNISGQTVVVPSTGAEYRWTGTAWVLNNIPKVADRAARDLLYSGAVVVVKGDTVFSIAAGMTMTYDGARWVLASGVVFPTSVTPTSGTATIGEDGVVTVTAAGACSFAGVNDGILIRTRMKINISVISVAATLLVQNKVGGGAVSTTGYAGSRGIFDGASPASAAMVTTGFELGSGTQTSFSGEINLWNAGVASSTVAEAHGFVGNPNRAFAGDGGAQISSVVYADLNLVTQSGGGLITGLFQFINERI